MDDAFPPHGVPPPPLAGEGSAKRGGGGRPPPRRIQSQRTMLSRCGGLSLPQSVLGEGQARGARQGGGPRRQPAYPNGCAGSPATSTRTRKRSPESKASSISSSERPTEAVVT